MIPDEIGKRLGPEPRKSDAWSDWLRLRSKLNLGFFFVFWLFGEKKCGNDKSVNVFIAKEFQLSNLTASANLLFKLTNPARIYKTN